MIQPWKGGQPLTRPVLCLCVLGSCAPCQWQKHSWLTPAVGGRSCMCPLCHLILLPLQQAASGPAHRQHRRLEAGGTAEHPWAPRSRCHSRRPCQAAFSIHPKPLVRRSQRLCPRTWSLKLPDRWARLGRPGHSVLEHTLRMSYPATGCAGSCCRTAQAGTTQHRATQMLQLHVEQALQAAAAEATSKLQPRCCSCCRAQPSRRPGPSWHPTCARGGQHSTPRSCRRGPCSPKEGAP